MSVRSVTAALVVGLCLAACSDDPREPSALPTLGPSPSASTAVEPTPTGIDAPTPEGAGAFARHWYAEIEAAFATRDPERVVVLSDPACEVCLRYVQSVRKLRDNDERVDGYAIEVLAAESPAGAGQGGSARVTAVYKTSGATRYAADGSVILEEPPYDLIEEELLLVRDGDSWKVQEVAAG